MVPTPIPGRPPPLRGLVYQRRPLHVSMHGPVQRGLLETSSPYPVSTLTLNTDPARFAHTRRVCQLSNVSALDSDSMESEGDAVFYVGLTASDTLVVSAMLTSDDA